MCGCSCGNKNVNSGCGCNVREISRFEVGFMEGFEVGFVNGVEAAETKQNSGCNRCGCASCRNNRGCDC